MKFSEVSIGTLFWLDDRPDVAWCKIPNVDDNVNAVLVNNGSNTVDFLSVSDDTECHIVHLVYEDDDIVAQE